MECAKKLKARLEQSERTKSEGEKGKAPQLPSAPFSILRSLASFVSPFFARSTDRETGKGYITSLLMSDN